MQRDLGAFDALLASKTDLHETDDALRFFRDHPQLTARQRWQQVDSPTGPLASLLPPFVSEGWPVPLRAVPGLGEHTGAILTELGLSAKEQDELRDAAAR